MNPINKDNWRQYLIMDSSGERLKERSLQNAILILAFAREQFGLFEVKDGRVNSNGGKWRIDAGEMKELSKEDITSLKSHLEYSGITVSKPDVASAIEVAAQYQEAYDD